jgi:hypothetical protein
MFDIEKYGNELHVFEKAEIDSMDPYELIDIVKDWLHTLYQSEPEDYNREMARLGRAIGEIRFRLKSHWETM